MKRNGGNFKAQAFLAGLVLPTAALVPMSAKATDIQTGLDNQLFFRGGFTKLIDDRAGESFTDTHGVLGSPLNSEDKGWYIGAGFDFQLTRDVWGMLPGTWVVAELGLEYNNFGTERTAVVVPTAECLITSACSVVDGDVNVTELTISASPKIKFLEGSAIRPWIIPVGLDIDVISPPSDAATVLDVGAQFGAGVDWEILHGIHLGVDGRYHFAADFTDTQSFVTTGGALAAQNVEQNNDHWNVGGYLGIGF